MIKTSNLTKKFNDTVALDRMNLEIKKGEIFGFLGPNGAGKTTAVRIFTGLLKPTGGQVTIGGYDIEKQPLMAKKITGLVPDTPFIYQKLTGREFLEFVGNLYEIPYDVRDERIEKYLSMFEMDGMKDILVENYSHGMKQKIVMASVLLHEPEYIFLDEPMVGLDPKSARLVKEIFLELSAKGVTIFMCTHTLEIAEKVCSRIGIIDRGRMIVEGTKEELHEKAQERTAGKIGKNLEDIFLELTGAGRDEELIKYL